MPFAQWDHSLETGDVRVDTQHRQLFSLVNDLHDAVVEQRAQELIEEVLYRMMHYAGTHFRDEEALMAEWDYPDTARHQMLHRQFTKDTKRLSEEFLDGEPIMSMTLSLYLHDWLTSHILGEDMRLVEHINMRKTAQGC